MSVHRTVAWPGVTAVKVRVNVNVDLYSASSLGAQVCHAFSSDLTVVPAHHAFIHWRNEPYLHFLSQPKLVLIYWPRRDGRQSWAGWLVCVANVPATPIRPGAKNCRDPREQSEERNCIPLSSKYAELYEFQAKWLRSQLTTNCSDILDSFAPTIHQGLDRLQRDICPILSDNLFSRSPNSVATLLILFAFKFVLTQIIRQIHCSQ